SSYPGGSMLGETGPSTLWMSMRITGPAAVRTDSSGNNFYTYNASNIEQFSATFGTGNWSAADLTALDDYPAPGLVYFDAPLSPGASLGMLVKGVETSNNLISFGFESASLNGSPAAYVGDPSGYAVTTSLSSATVSAVSLPPSAFLFATGLVAVGFTAVRTRRRECLPTLS
ncbi:MAG: hypothetical protein P8180_10055, partial [Gammaproteobacteria bacterium]